jgi:hypothetical protein
VTVTGGPQLQRAAHRHLAALSRRAADPSSDEPYPRPAEIGNCADTPPAPERAEPRTKKGTVRTAEATRARRPTSPKFGIVRDLLLKNVMTGKCADVPGNGKGTPGGPVVQHACRKTAKDTSAGTSW